MTTDTTAPVLLQERIGDVLLLTLNRPEKHNALNAAVHHWLGDAVARAPEEGVKVIVLTGAGEKSFCSGGDMAEMTGLDQNQTPL
ncbi:MAG: enoyl-CoA hydratase/isomerase family protein, partial [Dehalococcoidia bacterium]|nr:enoyl-CoA hydratase/isomerase family protein [Dehalococcoidia bacterium]